MKHRPMAGTLFKCFLLLTGAVLTLGPTPCNLRIDELPGSSEKEGREGTIDVFAVDHELLMPYDPATGRSAGTPQHRPLTVLKRIDKATPGIHAALSKGLTFKSAALDFYRIDPATRQEAKYYTVTLANIRIVGVKTMMPTTLLPENEGYGHMEEVRLLYESIEWNWVPDGIIERSEWRAPAAVMAPTVPAVGTKKE